LICLFNFPMDYLMILGDLSFKLSRKIIYYFNYSVNKEYIFFTFMPRDALEPVLSIT
jgi:hypothetical protein